MENPETTMNNATTPANAAPAVKIATAGEALIDLIGRPDGLFDPCLGGSVYNFTRAMARQDVGTLYLNPLSSDRFGRRLAEQLAGDGVVLARPDPVQLSTSLAVVGLTEAGHPDYAFYRQGIADRDVTAASLNASVAAAPSLEIVCTGCLALSPDDADVYLPWLAASRAVGKTVVVDANLRPSVMPDMVAYRANVYAALQHAHVIKASDEDLDHMAAPGATPLDKARYLLERSNATVFALTLGAEGAYLLTRSGDAWHVRESAPIVVVDTVGAGDCFLAGLVTGLLRDGSALSALNATSAQNILSHALASATLCVMRRGCQPPTLAEVLTRVRECPGVFTG
jgi:fructokinase